MKMPKENIDTVMFAPCGMNCMVCYKHCYHKKPCAGCLNSDMEKQKEKYTCSQCGGIISIHDRECSECQEGMISISTKQLSSTHNRG